MTCATCPSFSVVKDGNGKCLDPHWQHEGAPQWWHQDDGCAHDKSPTKKAIRIPEEGQVNCEDCKHWTRNAKGAVVGTCGHEHWKDMDMSMSFQ
ncbi:MAG: hypothetical protein PHR35_22915, partial [Kiritimatiellae bacterium]|nr:hypothetical protein [Kiritimatiellia bacterium]